MPVQFSCPISGLGRVKQFGMCGLNTESELTGNDSHRSRSTMGFCGGWGLSWVIAGDRVGWGGGREKEVSLAIVECSHPLTLPRTVCGPCTPLPTIYFTSFFASIRVLLLLLFRRPFSFYDKVRARKETCVKYWCKCSFSNFGKADEGENNKKDTWMISSVLKTKKVSSGLHEWENDIWQMLLLCCFNKYVNDTLASVIWM